MGKGRILAVDDQRYFRELLEALLCEEGYEVVTAEGGAEALAAIEAEDFDVVISDLVMPEIDGAELVERVRKAKADQDVIIVTGAADVKAAADAMKRGARDFILKPFDRATLLGSLERLMHARTLREEHAEMMARNLEYMSALSLYERAAGLFAAPGIEALSERLLDALCMETRAQGAVLWLAHDEDEPQLRLASVRGVVRVDREPEELSLSSLPGSLAEALRDGHAQVLNDTARSSLFIPLRDGASMLGLARVSDKLEGARFNELDRSQADRFSQIAGPAVANALRVRALERRSFRDPRTGAYSMAYLHEVARGEIRKAARCGRPVSFVRLQLLGVDEPERAPSPSEREEWLHVTASQTAAMLRGTDLVATGDDGCVEVLLPETDVIGATTLKHRLAALASEYRGSGAGQHGVNAALAVASYPSDGREFETLSAVLDDRCEDHRCSPVRRFERSDESVAAVLAELQAEAMPVPPAFANQLARLLCTEVARRPWERGLLFAHPASPTDPLRTSWETGLKQLAEALQDEPARTQIVMLGESDREERTALSPLALTWASAEPLGEVPPFVVYCGEGPSYVAVGGANGEPLYHSSDRTLCEHLSSRLQRELGLGASGA